jgi:hypothetical protein
LPGWGPEIVLLSYVTGITGVVLVALCWVWVQKVHREATAVGPAEADLLAGHSGCHGCAVESCEERSDSVEERT